MQTFGNKIVSATIFSASLSQYALTCLGFTSHQGVNPFRDKMLPPLIRIRNGYRDQLPHGLASLSEDPLYHDTVLVCQDGIVGASRFILALALPMLKRPLRGREEEEVVILMPNFVTHEVKHAMGMVFMASGITYEKEEAKNHPEEHKSDFVDNESNIEHRVVKTKDEDFLHIKHEVDSDHGQDVEYTDDGWEVHDDGHETSHNSKKVERRAKTFKYEHDSEDDAGNFDEDWEKSDDWLDTLHTEIATAPSSES